MTGVVKGVWDWSKHVVGGGTDWLAHAYGSVTGINALANAADKGLGIKAPITPPPPGAPTIDSTQAGLAEADRITRRRGVLANIYGGNTASTAPPSVGTKTLLGQ